MTDAAPGTAEATTPRVGPPYAIPGVTLSDTQAIRLAGTTVEYGWYSRFDRCMVHIDGDIAWSHPDHGRETRAALHAWEPIDALLFAHSYDPSRPLDEAVAFAKQWISLGTGVTDPNPAIAGRRSIRLAYLAAATDDAALTKLAAESAVELAGAIEPADISLATTEAITGLLTLIGRLAVGSHPVPVPPDVAGESLTAHLDACFGSDGMHRMGVPETHAGVVKLLGVLFETGYAPPTLGALRKRAEHALAWLIDPTGAPANFGNSTTQPMTAAYDLMPSGVRFLPERISDPALLHAASAGRFGTPPGHPIAVFRSGGFAAIKAPWPDRAWEMEATHLAMQIPTGQNAGNDALGSAMTWHDRGRRLLVEPGPALVTSDHPAAEYANTGAAHNTVLLDGEPARGANSDFVRWGSVRDVLHLETRVSTHDAEHRRTAVLDPGRWLLVIDRIDVAAGTTVGVRFHAGDEVDLIQADGGYTLLAASDPVLWAIPLADGTPIVPSRGVLQPLVSGWWSPDGVRMVPNWAFGWDGTGSTTFATLFSLDGKPKFDRADDPWIGWRTADYRTRVALTEWGVSDVEVRRATGEEND